MGKTVVVLGGSYAGLGVAHRLLKYTLPRVKDLKVVLISKNSHLYWNIASVRAIVPGAVKEDELLQAIEPGFAQYPKENAEFVVGAATGVDAASKTVKVATAAGDRDVPYDYLVIATGTCSADKLMPWKAAGTHDEILSSLHQTAQRVDAASHIVVAGAGPTGVEVVGELGHAYKGEKTIVLLSGSAELVNGDSIGRSVERELAKLGVDVRKGVKATASEALPDGTTAVTLSSGDTITTDLYLTTTGMVPNSGFLPPKWLTDSGFVDVDDEFRVKAAKDIWALGDIVCRPSAAWVHVDPHSAGIAKNIEAALSDKPQQAVKGMPVDAIICTTGRDRGVGRVSFVPVPSLVCWALKGRTLSIEKAPGYITGKHF
ncbi:hypothetical protein S7711_05672 [Stachybotrys chartarum IBT 7711]|uniref:FAD/NAD(P)-binding domain-containing protein n=1 Tax=Stachybotrys chartarum (strain CBS 109288 / IBT 7711) TaxID=1280523 RepID=A0A084B1I1_STACB|nr:hypothetical protein S7711_05672 [Stachybotrys chartarum IBT 7711]